MKNENFKKQLIAIQTNLLNFAYYLTSDRDDAYDLLQDTSLKVLDSEDKYTSNTNFKGWVFTIMRNLFINNYRKNVRAGVVIDQTQDLYHINSYSDASTDSPSGAYSVKEMQAAIGRLPRELGLPFSLYLSGYRYAEIAQRTGVPLGTVKSRIFFARKRLQSAFGPDREG